MIETFTALLFAHVLADFVLQTSWMAERKRNPGVLLVHGALVLLTAHIALGVVVSSALLALTAAHILIDAVKTWVLPDRLWAFLADQLAHLATLFAVALWFPGLWHAGAWASWPPLLHGMAALAGAILTTRAGGFAVGLLMQEHKATDTLPLGLDNGGKTIGYLERGLIFALVIVGQPAGIGFLIAAKSVLRFGAVQEDRSASEYVIIGTLASFGWALVTAYATQALIAALPPLAPAVMSS